MKTILFSGLVLLLAFVLLTWGRNKEKREEMAKTQTVSVKGMTCGGCSAGVALSLKKLKGVMDARVDHTKGTAVVKYDPAKVHEGEIISTVEKAGFKAEKFKSN